MAAEFTQCHRQNVTVVFTRGCVTFTMRAKAKNSSPSTLKDSLSLSLSPSLSLSLSLSPSSAASHFLLRQIAMNIAASNLRLSKTTQYAMGRGGRGGGREEVAELFVFYPP